MKQDTLQLPDQVIGYVVIHRPRVTRRIHLELGPDGNLQVVAPRRMSRRAINRTLQKKAAHVGRFLRHARSRQEDLVELSYDSGGQHLYLGRWLPLDVYGQAGKRACVQECNGRIRVTAPNPSAQQVKNLLGRWYRHQAATLFSARLEHYSALASWTGGKAPDMRLRIMKRTWGSCSSRGVITLNPHLVKAPGACIDYVVAHEICHLREHNHGRAFYALQEQLFPRWREARGLLKDRGHVYLHS